MCVMSVAQLISGIVVGFIYGPRMASVILASCPAIAISGYIFFMVTTKYNKLELDAYAKAGDVAEEVLSSIRTVTAFGGQDRLKFGFCYVWAMRRRGCLAMNRDRRHI